MARTRERAIEAPLGTMSGDRTAAIYAIGWGSLAACGCRQAGSFRLAPFGVTVPNSRTYEPGTNTLVTTWNTRGGWVVVRDALTMGPHTGEDRVTPYTRPPSDDGADHMLLRTVQCIEGQ